MKEAETFSKKGMHIYIIIIAVIFAVVIVGLLMLKYHVEGETDLPFVIKKISIISTAKRDFDKDEEDVWYISLSQQNNIYIEIEKNSYHRKEDVITKVIFENFVISKEKELGEIVIYKTSEKNNLYNYSEETIVKDRIEYNGAQFTDTKLLEINNQGGLIGFSILNKDIGESILIQNEVVPSDGRLLELANVQLEDIKFTISFDIIIETGSQKKFKANVVFDLPEGNILKDGVGIWETEGEPNVVFKRF